MIVKIDESELFGTAEFPASKSISHRLIIAAALANGQSKIHGISRCDDVMATITSLSMLGAKFSFEDDIVTISGIDIKKAKVSGPLFVNESGSTLRFLIPLLYLTGEKTRFTGAKRLFERPLGIYKDIAKEQNLYFELNEDYLDVNGVIRGGEYKLAGNVSSQFITGLLFALPLIDEDSRIIIEPPFESRPYVDMTIDALSKFGVRVKFENDNTIEIKGGQKYQSAECNVEGDWSGGAFLLALKMLHEGVDIDGYNNDSLQGDRVAKEYFEKIQNSVPTLDITDCPDLGPILFAMAAYFNGATFTGTRRLRIKESDRAEAMKIELAKFGARVEIFDDSVKVSGGIHGPEENLFGHNDHRIVMSLAVLASKLGGVIIGAEAIKKSYPEFFETTKGLGLKIDLLDGLNDT